MKARGAGQRATGEETGRHRAAKTVAAKPWARPLVAGWGHIALPLACLALTAGCDNMKDQRNYRPLDPSPLFRDGASARQPPAHTVAHDEHPDNGVFLTGNLKGNPVTDLPLPLTVALLERGQARFNIYCAVCHGEDGYGRGIVVRRGFPAPPTYHDDRLRQAPVGHFFEVITRGYGTMSSFAEQVAPADRWAIAAYIRALQRSQAATLADVPPEARGQFNASVP